MKRKLFEIKLIDNCAQFYIMNGEIIHVNDLVRPEPIENHSTLWNGNKFCYSDELFDKIQVPLFRMKKEHTNKFIKDNLRILADSTSALQNLFVVKKQIGDYNLIGIFARNAIGGKYIEEYE